MQKRLSYKDAIRRSHREAAYTLAAALLLFLFFWCALFLTADSGVFLFGLPLWFGSPVSAATFYPLLSSGF